MKEIKKFVIADFIVFIFKLLGGLLCNSYTMLTSSCYDLFLVFISLFCSKNIKNTKGKAIITSLFGFLMILSSLGLIFISLTFPIKKPSLLILIFLIFALITRYIVTAFATNQNYSKKEGLLTYGNLNSNIDFYNYGIIILSLILSKISKWFSILKYSDRVTTILIAILIFYKGIKIIINSFKYIENKEQELDENFKNEITNRPEVNKITSVIYNNFGGIRYIKLNVNLKENINMVDITTFMATLRDYLLKKCEITSVNMVKEMPKKVTKNARNSGSRNGKTSTKKTNTKKKNKKS